MHLATRLLDLLESILQGFEKIHAKHLIEHVAFAWCGWSQEVGVTADFCGAKHCSLL